MPLDRAAFSRRRDDLKVGRTAPQTAAPTSPPRLGMLPEPGKVDRARLALFQADSGATPTTLRSCTRRLDCEGTWGFRVTSVKVVEIGVWPPESMGQAGCVVMLRSRSLSAASICAKASTCM